MARWVQIVSFCVDILGNETVWKAEVITGVINNRVYVVECATIDEVDRLETTNTADCRTGSANPDFRRGYKASAINGVLTITEGDGLSCQASGAL
ncbi:hypothetical protein BHYA_0449g00040 [Botrytis hyacinthi]|uniref:Uncharacterized protein n=1 Tax=Botrytis hyacinthi TaxID=278943 RepID=A0A4Z1G6R2_9HELO|nr:hypothetical protein BHYA_0449g00040 [Botrytis hyacinthi]